MGSRPHRATPWPTLGWGDHAEPAPDGLREHIKHLDLMISGLTFHPACSPQPRYIHVHPRSHCGRPWQCSQAGIRGPGLEKASWSGPVAGWKGMRSNRDSGCMNTQCCMIRDSARAPSEHGAYTQAGSRAWQTGPWPESPASAAAQESAEPRTSLEAGHIPAFPQAGSLASQRCGAGTDPTDSALSPGLQSLPPLGGWTLGRDGGCPAPLPRSGVLGGWEGDLGPESLQVNAKEVWG